MRSLTLDCRVTLEDGKPNPKRDDDQADHAVILLAFYYRVKDPNTGQPRPLLPIGSNDDTVWDNVSNINSVFEETTKPGGTYEPMAVRIDWDLRDSEFNMIKRRWDAWVASCALPEFATQVKRVNGRFEKARSVKDEAVDIFKKERADKRRLAEERAHEAAKEQIDETVGSETAPVDELEHAKKGTSEGEA